MVEDPEDHDVDETPARAEIIMAQRKEVVAGKPMVAGRIELEMLPSGKRLHNYGKIHHF